jgi:Exostosin family
VFSIFSDRSFLTSSSSPHAVILSPFWGTIPDPPPDTGRFDRYAEVGSSYLRLSRLVDCDVGVFPQNWETAGERAAELAGNFATICRDAGKTPVVFSGADPTEPLPVDATVFRPSLIRSQRRPNEFALPAWSEDFLDRYLGGELRARPRRARPTVGFCGNTMVGRPPRRFGKTIRRLLGNSKSDSTHSLTGDHPRTLALLAIDRDHRLQPNFVLRGTFWGARDNPSSVLKTRREYVRNMQESDYVLCASGIGNFSYRLYETLSMGRIPVFIDTDSVLPLEFEIDWREWAVWVDEHDIDRIGDRVLEFHESLSDAEFEELQQACRRLWETHISPQGFFAFFHRHFHQT